MFIDRRFPTDISFGAKGGPRYHTVIAESATGHEHRNAQWRRSRREWNAGYGVKSLSDVDEVIAFFEEARGRWATFRWLDKTDDKSCGYGETPSATDQLIGTGDGIQKEFQLKKAYGTNDRIIYLPRSLQVAVNGTRRTTGWTQTDGLVAFTRAPVGRITAGFEFDCHVRFNTDKLELTHETFNAGKIANIPVIEVRK